MKRLLLLILLFTSITTFSQVTYFPGNKAEVFIGKKVILKTDQDKIGYFYKDKKIDKLLYPIDKSHNDIEKLKNLEFKVIDVIPSPYKSSKDKLLVLDNPETGKVYYKYYISLPEMLVLEVKGGMPAPDGYYCNQIKTSTDKFTDAIEYTIPETFEYSLSKTVENSIETYYLRLVTHAYPLASGNGVKILFDDKSILEFPNEGVRHTSASDYKGWHYSAYIKLTDEDITKLLNKTIISYRLNIFDRDIMPNNAYELKEYLKCLTKK